MNRHSIFANPELMMDENALEELLEDKPVQPTHFRCPKCYRVYPISELSYLPEIKYESSYNMDANILGAGIKRTTTKTIIKHPVCKKCFEKEKENEKQSLINIAFVIVLIIIVICIISHLK